MFFRKRNVICKWNANLVHLNFVSDIPCAKALYEEAGIPVVLTDQLMTNSELFTCTPCILTFENVHISVRVNNLS